MEEVVGAWDIVQVLISFTTFIAFLTGFSALRQRHRLEFLRESVRAANERLEDLAERQDALPLPTSAANQEIRRVARDPLTVLVNGLSLVTVFAVVSGLFGVGSDEFRNASDTVRWFVTLTIIIIIGTYLLGLFDLLWGRRETAGAIREYTARCIASVMVSFVVVARLILVQQLHIGLVARLEAVRHEPGRESDTAALARLVTELPKLLIGAGVPPWLIRRARRRAASQMADVAPPRQLAETASSDVAALLEEAAVTDLLLLHFHPTVRMWQAFDARAEELRRKIPEWEWIDLLSAWAAAGVRLSSYDSSAEVHTRSVLLRGLDFRRSLAIHEKSRETDRRDLAAWSIASAVDRRAPVLPRGPSSSVAGETSLWDSNLSIGMREGAPAGDATAMGSINHLLSSFQVRDPIVWLALAEPLAQDLSWVDLYITERNGRLMWRGLGEPAGMTSDTKRLMMLACDAKEIVHRITLGDASRGVIEQGLIDVLSDELTTLGLLRFGGALDVARTFQFALVDTAAARRPQARRSLRRRWVMGVNLLRVALSYPRHFLPVLLLVAVGTAVILWAAAK